MRLARWFTHWLARRVAGFPTLISLTPRASAYRSVAIADSRAKKRRIEKTERKFVVLPGNRCKMTAGRPNLHTRSIDPPETR